MPRNKKKSEELLDLPEMGGVNEEIPEIASKRGSHLRVVKDFDLRAAHHAWKERHGIDETF